MNPAPPRRSDAGAGADVVGPLVAGLVLRAGEPAAGPWREVAVASLLTLLERSEVPAGRPRAVATPGAGAAGSRRWWPAWHAQPR